MPDSTRGVGFTIVSNRRDLLVESRVELNGAARAFDRLLGARPENAEIRLTSDEKEVVVTIRIGARAAAAFSLPLGREDRGRGRISSPAMRVASTVVLVMSREWLSDFVRELVPGDTSSTGWLARERIPAWLRLGILQSVAEHPIHERWMAQLARQRDAMPSVDDIFLASSCDAGCLARFGRVGTSDAANPDGLSDVVEIESGSPGDRAGFGRGRLPELDGRARYLASTYALVQFMAKREGPAYLRTLLTTALTGGDMALAIGTARSFSASTSDIDRQWKVWLASYAFPGGR